jgi:hypothetical protein
LLSPVVLCVFVEEINPGRVSRPAIAKVDIIGSWMTNKYISVVGSGFWLIFNDHTILPDIIVLDSFYVRIDNYSDASV